jgi:hypothetical protein
VWLAVEFGNCWTGLEGGEKLMISFEEAMYDSNDALSDVS